MSDKIEQYSRFEFHTLTTSGYTGTTFTIPTNEDSLNTWEDSDLGLSEIGVNEYYNRAFIRIGDTINEFALVSTGTTGFATLTAGTCTVFNTVISNDYGVMLTSQDGGVTGNLRCSVKSAGVFFRIDSTNAGDAGVVLWQLLPIHS